MPVGRSSWQWWVLRTLALHSDVLVVEVLEGPNVLGAEGGGGVAEFAAASLFCYGARISQQGP